MNYFELIKHVQNEVIMNIENERVIFSPKHFNARNEAGIIKKIDYKQKIAFVWYTSGCHAVATRFEDLIVNAEEMLEHHPIHAGCDKCLDY